MKEKQIYKRTGQIVAFDTELITIAIDKAIKATPNNASIENLAQNLSNEIEHEIKEKFFKKESVPTVENIQDIVEQKLVESGNLIIAKTYILYRAQRAEMRIKERLEQLKKLDQNLLNVTKHNGLQEKFARQKLHNIWNIAARGYENICPFDKVFEVFKIMLVDGITTDQILRNLCKASIDMITVENIAWEVIAGRLYVMQFYKQACRNRKINHTDIYTPQAWKAHFDDYMAKGFYSDKFKLAYTDTEILEAGNWINKERDFSYLYSTHLSFGKRYLLNPNNIVHELPQEMYLAVALFLAIPEEKENRLQVARRIYEATSSQKLSLATPTLLNARTTFHQLSSCFKLNVDDDLRSIYHSIENIAQISKFGGGVGIYLGHIRSRGASIRGVKNTSGGVVPWVRVINDTACAVNQLGARIGSVSPTIDVWHRDVNDFLNLQTETGDIRSKAFDVYPAVSVPDLFMQRVEEDKEWTLFDPHEIAKVTGKKLENFFNDEFRQFYLECENNLDLELKEKVSAKELMKEIMKTAVETGMPYIFFRDTVNRLNPNKHAGSIYATQLCTEICQNTSESTFVSETEADGKVSVTYKAGDSVVCNLASLNIAKAHTDVDIKEITEIGMRVLDNVITLNFYPIKETEITAKKYRSVGLGFMGLAEYLACNKLAYDSQEARTHVDGLFERYAFYSLDASANLAKERGKYQVFEGSEWSRGVFFGKDENWFRENSKTDKNWSELINRVKTDGLRFAYHFAPAPNTSTAGVVGTTAGLLPIYKKFFIETNNIAPTVKVAPNLNKENFWYYKEYQNVDMADAIDMMAVIYKWIDQSISFEWMINPQSISPQELHGYYVKAWKAGIKTIYYVRSMSGVVEDNCISCSG